MLRTIIFSALLLISLHLAAQRPLRYVIVDNVISKNSRIHTICAYTAEPIPGKLFLEATINDIVTKYFLKETDFRLLKIFLYPSRSIAMDKEKGYYWSCLYQKYGTAMASYEYHFPALK